jgi:hypothetical protein
MPLPISTVTALAAIVFALIYDGSHQGILSLAAAAFAVFAVLNETARFIALRPAVAAPPARPRTRQATPHVGGDFDDQLPDDSNA